MRTIFTPRPARVLGIVAFCLLACICLTPKAFGQNVGIGTAAPVSRLHVSVCTADATGLMVTGTQNAAGTFPDVGATTALIWIPRKSAFRVGTSTTTQWDNANVGRFSSAMGYGATASGVYSFAAGYLPLAQMTSSVAIGFQPEALGSNSVALGQGVVAASASEVVVGAYNTSYTPVSNVGWNASDRLFVVGNGNSSAFRSDALVILKNGNTGIGTATPTALLHVDGTLRVGAYTLPATDGTNGQVLRTNGAGVLTWGASASDLHTAYIAGPVITTNATQGPVEIAGNQGLLVHGPLNLGVMEVSATVPIGNSIVSFIPGRGAFLGGRRLFFTDWEAANIGAYSFCYGYGSQAIGNYSVAMGYSSAASGISAVCFGQNSEATGNYSFAIGNSSIASANSSIALGSQATASGDFAFATGQQSVSSGMYSTAIGRMAESTGLNSVAVGLQASCTGDNACAFGYSSIANGYGAYSYGLGAYATADYAVALGQSEASGVGSMSFSAGGIAQSFRETVLGMFNETNVPLSTTTWNINDRLLVIGNGTLISARSNALVMLKSGRTGLGVNVPTYRLDLPNTASTLGQGRANAWLTYSDGRVKTGNRPLPYGLQTVMALRPQQYEHHSSTFENGRVVLDAAGPVATRLGFVAQDLAQVVPEAATAPTDSSADLWAVDYTALVPVLVKALQEQQAQIEALQATVTQQAAQLQQLTR